MKKTPACLWILAAILFLAGCGGDEKVRTGQGAKSTQVQAQAEARNIEIGAGSVTGDDYATAAAIAEIVNRKRPVYNLNCSVEATGGSVFNVNALMAGDLEFGLVQSDRQYRAVKGLAEWHRKGPQTDLRAVFGLHPQSLTLVAAVDAHIMSISDLKGKRVDIGNTACGQRRNAIDALKNAGIDYESDLHVEMVKGAQAPELLQEARIDAFICTVAHPSDAIREAVSGTRKIALIPITGISTLLAKHPYYTRSYVPVSMYPGVANQSDVPTFGLRATLVTSVKVPDAVVYAMVKAVLENFDEFKNLRPALAVLTRHAMLEGLAAPLHPGAVKYFKEVGLLK